MTCPKCQSRMEKVEFGGVEVDRCDGCRGIWFDAGERESLKELSGSEVVDVGDEKEGAEFDRIRAYKCPKCGGRMLKMTAFGRHAIHYEACLGCGGMFLDAGEFRDEKKTTLLQRIRAVLAEGGTL